MRYDAIWEYGFLEELVGRDKVILQKDFEDILNSGTVSVPQLASIGLGSTWRLMAVCWTHALLCVLIVTGASCHTNSKCMNLIIQLHDPKTFTPAPASEDMCNRYTNVFDELSPTVA